MIWWALEGEVWGMGRWIDGQCSLDEGWAWRKKEVRLTYRLCFSDGFVAVAHAHAEEGPECVVG